LKVSLFRSVVKAQSVFTWKQGQPSSMAPSDADRRPPNDHTQKTDTGFYLYADSSPTAGTTTEVNFMSD